MLMMLITQQGNCICRYHMANVLLSHNGPSKLQNT
jgi:hypothetical protein